ncbi:MAG: M48 family metallopeptidase [Chloroflexota bacterium]
MQIDRLIRSKRKTVALIIERDGRLVVRAPQHLSLPRIQSLVDAKAAWIEQKRAQIETVQAAHPATAPKRYENGESFAFLGAQYPLAIVPGERPRLTFVKGKFLLTEAGVPHAERLFTAWYRRQARQICGERSTAFARQMGVTYARIRISSARTRWGSCSSRGTLSFTWRLVLMPQEIIDYVVVHELAHRCEPNHSPRFWAVVEQYMPDYKRRRAWLKKGGNDLAG